MDPIDKLVWTWRPVLELGLASKDSFVYLLHFLLLQEQRNILIMILAFNQYNDTITPCRRSQRAEV